MILKNVNAGKNNLSSLLNDKKIVKSPNDVDRLTTELCRMVALSLIKLEITENEDGEEDVMIEITDLGKAYLKYMTVV